MTRLHVSTSVIASSGRSASTSGSTPGGAAGYDVVVAVNALLSLGAAVREVAPHGRAALVMDANVREPHGVVAEASLREAGFQVLPLTLHSSEPEKSLESAAILYRGLLAGAAERNTPVIALGGGIVGDVTGFVASTYLRGVPFIQAPTTLLAMVDAAIGGKTGVNVTLPGGGLGKNLVGAFWQPRLVLADPRVLVTLPRRELCCGLAECIKHAMLADEFLLDLIESKVEQIFAVETETIEALVARSAAIKIAIVEADPLERGVRATLNLGHTFAHAIESFSSLNLLHGEAVSLGLCAAMACAESMGRVTDDERRRIVGLLERLSLPTRLPSPIATAEATAAMAHDKKVEDGRLRLVLPRSPGQGAEIVADVPLDRVHAAWRSIGTVG